MFKVFCALLKRLRERGFQLGPDPAVSNLRSLKKTHRLAQRADDLNASAELSGRYLSIEFFSEKQRVNKCGGKYDFDKLAKMTRTNQLKAVVELMGLLRMLVEFGYTFRVSGRGPEIASLDYLVLRDIMRDSHGHRLSPLGRFNRGWEASRFKRDDSGWPIESEYADPWRSLDGDEKPLRKKIMAVVTDSTPLEDPKDPEACKVFALYGLFATPDQRTDLAARYRAGGLGYGHAKEELFELFWEFFRPMRSRRDELLADPGYVDKVLHDGADKARATAEATLDEVRQAVGLR